MTAPIRKRHPKSLDSNKSKNTKDNSLFAEAEIAVEEDRGRKEFEKGWLYYCGIGVQQSSPKAFKYFRKAAAQGYELAQSWIEILVRQNMQQEHIVKH